MTEIGRRGIGMEERPPGVGGRGGGSGDPDCGTGEAVRQPVAGAPPLGARLNITDYSGTTFQNPTVSYE